MTSYGGFVVVLRVNLKVFLALEEGAQLLILGALCKLPRGEATVVGHVETRAGVHQHATDCPPLVRRCLVQSRLTFLIVPPVHDRRRAVYQEELDDVLVAEPCAVVEAGLPRLVHGEEGVALAEQLGQHLQVAKPRCLQNPVGGFDVHLLWWSHPHSGNRLRLQGCGLFLHGQLLNFILSVLNLGVKRRRGGCEGGARRCHVLSKKWGDGQIVLQLLNVLVLHLEDKEMILADVEEEMDVLLTLVNPKKPLGSDTVEETPVCHETRLVVLLDCCHQLSHCLKVSKVIHLDNPKWLGELLNKSS